MTFSTADFVAQVQDGFLKPNRYRITFPIPQALSDSPAFTNQLQSLQFYSDSIDLVDAGFLSRNVVRYGYGVSEKKPFAPQFNDVMITFYNDSLSSNLGFFQWWANTVQAFNMSQGIYVASSGGTGNQPYELFYKDEYVVDAMVTLLDAVGNDVITYRMRRSWPIHIPNIKLGWAINNDIMRLTVIFNYMDWYPDASAGGTLNNYYNSFSSSSGTQLPPNAINTPGQPLPTPQ